MNQKELTKTLLGPTGGQELIKFIAPEFVFFWGEKGVLCVGNDLHFCKTVVMNMSNISFEVAR